MKKENRQKGFTLIEMIVSLVLVGILSAFAGMGIVAGVQGYLFAKETASVNEKAQLALMRINRELLECYNCNGTATASLVNQPFENNLGTRYIRQVGSNIVIADTWAGDGDILLDNVAAGSFTMIYQGDKNIQISFKSSVTPSGASVPPFTSRVYPRNTRFD